MGTYEFDIIDENNSALVAAQAASGCRVAKMIAAGYAEFLEDIEAGTRDCVVCSGVFAAAPRWIVVLYSNSGSAPVVLMGVCAGCAEGPAKGVAEAITKHGRRYGFTPVKA